MAPGSQNIVITGAGSCMYVVCGVVWYGVCMCVCCMTLVLGNIGVCMCARAPGEVKS